MKKVMIYAYTNYNLGDDLFIKILCERYPKVMFVLYAPRNYNVNFNNVNNIIIYPSNSLIGKGSNFLSRNLNIKNVFQRIIAKKCDVAVHIGGSIFMQKEGWVKNNKNKRSMLIKNQPFFVLGANFGPFKDNEFYQWNKERFKKYTDLCFRDNYSFNLFKDLDNVRLADDIVFQLKKQEVKFEENYIVISVIKPSYRRSLSEYDDIYYKKIKEISIYFIQKGYMITYMSFCENEGDKEAIEKIMKLIPENYINRVQKHLYNLNIQETLNIIAASNFVIATRFHSMILGWLFKKTVFPIVYSDKMTNVMKDVGFKGLYTDFDKIYELKAEHVFQSMKSNLIDVSRQVKNAEKHFEKLDEFLK